ncbi:MAG: glycosyltransferase family 2 protein [Solobacterium sp.]|nr:glycosyltransferase family 2 protein [Solobacterium sp.]
MKILSIAVPCYNSQDYMEHCVETLLTGGEKVEIIIVDDGSKDDTAAIADRLAEKYPTIIKAVHQENGGHGEAVNTGIKNATGVFFKVVDSDDWLGEEALATLLEKLEMFSNSGEDAVNVPDLVLCNYIYDKVGVKNKKVINYKGYLPLNRTFTWKDVRKMPPGKYMTMHACVYRTEVLRESQLVLPKHTFYVKKLYYLDINLYHYFIGRDDQSVNEKVMIKRLDQQLRVNKIMIDTLSAYDKSIPNCTEYMYSYLEIISAITSVLATLSGTPEHLAMKEDLWKYMQETDEEIYHKVRYSFVGRAVNLPGKFGQSALLTIYKLAQKLYGFN